MKRFDASISTESSAISVAITHDATNACKRCQAPFGHFGHCPAVNRDVRFDNAADALRLRSLGVIWNDEPELEHERRTR